MRFTEEQAMPYLFTRGRGFHVGHSHARCCSSTTTRRTNAVLGMSMESCAHTNDHGQVAKRKFANALLGCCIRSKYSAVIRLQRRPRHYRSGLPTPLHFPARIRRYRRRESPIRSPGPVAASGVHTMERSCHLEGRRWRAVQVGRVQGRATAVETEPSDGATVVNGD